MNTAGCLCFTIMEKKNTAEAIYIALVKYADIFTKKKIKKTKA